MDPVREPWLTGRELDFLVRLPDGRHLSIYPVLPAVLAAPLYAVSALFAAPLSEGFLHDLSKLSGTLITAASAGVFYAALRERCSERWAFFLAALYGAGSWAMSVSSQALWQHGPSQLGVALGLWGLARPGAGRGFAAGLGFGLSVAARPDGIFLAAAAAALWLWKRRGELAPFCAGAALPAAFLLGYWLHYTGRLAPPELHAQTRNFLTLQPEALVGMLFTPARGLFLYFPPALFSLWALWRRRDAESLLLAAGCAGKLVFLAHYDNWVGGLSFGTRYFASMTLLFLWWLAPLEREIAGDAFRRRAWAACAAAALIVHALGGYLRWPGTFETLRTKARLWTLSEHPVVHLLDDRGGLADWPFLARALFLAALLGFGAWLARRLERSLTAG